MALVINTPRLCRTVPLQWANGWIHHWSVLSMFPGPPKSTPGSTPSTSSSDDADIGSRSHRLMSNNRLIQGPTPGTFHLLPLTTRAVEKLYRVIDKEMHSIGAQKVAMPCLSLSKPWIESGRYEMLGSELFTLDDRKGAKLCLSPTHEEAVTALVAAEAPISYKHLPIKLYQIGRKFRDEMRPKSGLLRCREFEMKDLYSFDEDEQQAALTYEKVCDAYVNIFKKLGLDIVKVEADTGAMGGNLSHEFQLLSDVGEDTVFICQSCGRGINKELVEGRDPAVLKCTQPNCGPDFKQSPGIEVAHTFLLGTRYSNKFKALYIAENGSKRPLFMGCYGIGVTRLLAAALEVNSLQEELRWPHLLAPHQAVIIPQKEGYKSEITLALAHQLYKEVSEMSHLDGEVVLDDRLNLSIGKRLYQAKQQGFPYAIVAGRQSLEDPPKFEVLDIYSDQKAYLTFDEVLSKLKQVQIIPLF